MLSRISRIIAVILVALFINFQLPSFAQSFKISQTIVEDKTPDPLAGEMETEELQIELQKEKRDPATAALLSMIFPGIGQIYTGDSPRGSAIIVGGIGVMVATSILAVVLDATDNNFARWVAILVGGGGYVTYVSWAATDAYYQAELLNQKIEYTMKNVSTTTGLKFTLFTF